MSSSLSALLVASVPLFAAVVAWLTGSERLDLRGVGGLALGFGGVAVLVGFNVGRSDLLATLSLGIVSLGYALGPWILSRHLSDLPGVGVVAARRAVRYGDGWIPLAGRPGEAGDVFEVVPKFREMLKQAGRDPKAVRLSARLNTCLPWKIENAGWMSLRNHS